ncbi:MAG: hypothetical protein QXR45_09360 [Candidatus Bathyarchaeia archaeon]
MTKKVSLESFAMPKIGLFNANLIVRKGMCYQLDMSEYIFKSCEAVWDKYEAAIA